MPKLALPTALVLALGLALICFAALVGQAQATPGAFDPTFGTAGLAVNQFAASATPTSLGTDVAVAPDGKIIVAGAIEEAGGTGQVMVARYLPNGTLDTSFGSGGAVVFQAGKGTEPRSVALYSGLAVMPDGRIVIAGSASGEESSETDAMVARLLPDGQLDPSFNGGYVVQQLSKAKPDRPFSEFIGLALEPGGKIVVTGASTDEEGHDEFLAERFGSNGAPDGSFGTAGVYRRQLGSGTGSSSVPSSIGSDVIRQADGSLLFSGGASESETAGELALVKLTPSGHLNLGFGSGGVGLFQPSVFPGTITAAFRLAEQPGGEIVLGGVASFDAKGAPAFAVARFSSSGAIDPTFGAGGATLTQVSSAPNPGSEGVGLVIQANGRILLPGLVEVDNKSHYIFTVLRYTAGGTLDPTFATEGVLQEQLSADSTGSSVGLGATIDPGGQLLVAGADAVEGALASMLARVELDKPPSVTFTYPGAGCSSGPSALTFTANATDGEDPITAVDWDFSGNGQFADAHGTTVTVPPSAITAPGGKVSVRVTNGDALTATATQPPPPIPPCLPPIRASVKLLGKGLTMDSHGDVVLKLSASGPVSGTATLTATQRKAKASSKKHKKAKTKTIKLGSAHFNATKAGTITVKLHLSSSAQAIVRKTSSLKGTLTLLTSGGGSAKSTTAVTLKASKAKRKHSHKRSK